MGETGAEQGVLHVVATPLGNDADLSERARAVLSGVDAVLAEDTRRSGLLFQRLNLPKKKFISFHDHNEEQRIPAVLEALGRGESLAMVSDAGTPLLSDPGYRLVRACREQGVKVVPVPGPCAPIVALSACGLPPLPFTFLGFPPRKVSQLKKLLTAHRDTGATLVLFERKSRLSETLAVAREALGERDYCVARELTKDFEEFILGNLGRPDPQMDELRGEITVVIGPPEGESRTPGEDMIELLREESALGGKPKEIARRAAARATGWTAKDAYAQLGAATKAGGGR